MEELILKQYDSEVKSVEGERALNVTITTNDIDRSGDIVEPKGAKLVNFRKNPVVLMAHDYQGLPIGKASELTKTDNGITAKVTFPDEGVYPLADTVFNMYKQKFMKAWSIGFIPIKSEDIVDDEKEDSKSVSRGRRFKTWELLEFSACSVPSNPNALSNMISKGINVDPLKEAGFIEIIEEEKAKYNCECIKCKYKTTSDKHCKDIKCPKCGGTMRRVERPGPGQENYMEENVINKPEETDESIRIPVKGEEGKHKGHKIRWIEVDSKKGIRGIYCIDCKKIITFVFEKKKGWTMAKAKKWMEDHEKMVENYFLNIDPDSFKDLETEEIDWEEVKASIEKEEKEEGYQKVGLLDVFEIYDIIKENKELKEKLKDVELKAGAVLNAKNKKDLKNAQGLIQSVLDSAGDTEEDSKIVDDDKKGDKGDDDVIELVTDIVDNAGTDKEKDGVPDKTLDIYEVDDKEIKKMINDKIDYVTGRTVKTK